METSETDNRYLPIFLSFLLIIVFYLIVTQSNEQISIGFFVLIAIIHLKWPNEALLLLIPSFLPTVNLDIGLGFTPLRIILVGVVIGQVIRGQWNSEGWKGINRLLIIGWIILITSLFVSTWVNEGSFMPSLFVWISRAALMLVYISAWRYSKNPEFGYWGWLIGGLLAFAGGIIVYIQTGSILEVRYFAWSEGNYSLDSVPYIFLTVSGFVVASFWSAWSLFSKKLLSGIKVSILSILFALPLFMSGRRQAVYGMAFSILFMVFSIPGKQKIKISLVILASTIMLLYSGFFATFFEGRETIWDELAGRGTGRYHIYTAGIEGFREKPILGWGLGSYRSVMFMQGVITRSTGEGASSHNSLIGVGVEAGLVGVIGLTMILLGCIQESIRLVTYTRKKGVGPWTYTFPILGFIVAGILFSNIIESHWYLLSLALLCGVANKYSSNLSKDY